MADQLVLSHEQAVVTADVQDRFRGAWKLFDQATESGGTNVRAVSRIFLRSLFEPRRMPAAETYPAHIDRALAERLRSPGPLSSVHPSEDGLAEAEKRMVQRILDVTPATVPRALETLDELAKASKFTIWTVGDYTEQTYTLPDELLGSGGVIEGTGHQLWKMYKLGLTGRNDIQLGVSNNKIADVLPRIHKQETEGIKRFVFIDDRFENLRKIKELLDQESLTRELAGEDPLQYDLILVNQGSRRQDRPAELPMKGSLGTYLVVDHFAQTAEQVRAIKEKSGGQISVFCDFDGVVTDNVAVRREWDEVAVKTAQEVVDRSKLVNPQKKKRGGEQLTSADLRLAAVKDYIEACRAKGLRIGVKNGAYDIIQPGHIGGFDDAKDACDVLIVVINSDASIEQYKGVKENVPRPLIPEAQRADVLLGLEAVDGVVLFDEKDPSAVIRALKPDVYISSQEYEGKPLPEFEAATEVGADIVYTNIREGYSTSSIVRRVVSGFLKVAEGNAAFTGAADAAKVLKKIAGYA